MLRREFIQLVLGSSATLGVGAVGCGGRSTAKPFAPGTSNQPRAAKRKTARACIFLYMAGGPSQLDTFDPKPGTANAAGTKALATSVAGLQLGEGLSRLAAQAKHLAVLRSISSKEGSHARARYLMHTGYTPAGGIRHPAFGAITAASLGKGPLPSYVSVGGPGADAGFLGAAHAPFPVFNPQRPLRNLERARFVDQPRFDERVRLWRELETDFANSHDVPQVRNQRAVGERALAMMKASQLAAFDLSKEPASAKAAYGTSKFGLGCLMARRLVEVGVPFVQVTLNGWDTHTDHATRIKPLCRDLDAGMSALIADLAQRGLLESTLVVWTGDFGRTPRISPRGGRDHYPKVTPAVLAGGGVRGGQVIGQTDKTGESIVGSAVSVPDVYRSIAHTLGIDPDTERTSRAGRPIATVDGGTIISSLF